MVSPQDVYARLMVARRGTPFEDALARMLASWSTGGGILPDWLGLDADRFCRLVGHHFPGIHLSELPNPGRKPDPDRCAEMADLRKLLLDNRSLRSELEIPLVDIMIAGCMGSDHLWQDLGLWERRDLSRLMSDNFAPLAARNSRDMKWKKFLYKQLCESEGVYTCRAPSCEVCADYLECFGPEE